MHERLNMCKDLARMGKNIQVVYRPLFSLGLEKSIPSREIADVLFHLYLENFELTYR